MTTAEAEAILSQKREGFRRSAKKIFDELGPSHPVSKYLSIIVKALGHRPPTKREKDLIFHLSSPHQGIPSAYPKWDWNTNEGMKPKFKEKWDTRCVKCDELASRAFTIIAGVPVCESCHAMFEMRFDNLVLSDLDIEFEEPRVLSRDRNPMGLSDDFDIDLE